MSGLGNPTQPHQKLKTRWLALMALALIGLWQISEHFVPRRIAPHETPQKWGMIGDAQQQIAHRRLMRKRRQELLVLQ